MSELATLIREYSALHDIEPKIIAAIIYQESRGNPWAFRYEDGFFARYIKPLFKRTLPGHVPKTISLSSEKRARSMSWGLMQIMGNSARVYAGFNHEELTRLLDPEINLDVGCEIFKRYLNLAASPKFQKKRNKLKLTITEYALLLWNGGGNKNYPHEVLWWIANGQYKEILGER